MLVGAIIVILLLVAGSILLIFWPKISKRNEEKDFLKDIYHSVYNIAMDKDFYVIHDVAIEIDTKIIHFNHILFGNKYIYCISDCYHNGHLSGKYNDQQWFKYLENGEIIHIKNPMLLHSTRIRYLNSVLNSEDLIIGICVVNNQCLLDELKDSPSNVVILHENEIRSYVYSKEKENIMPIDAIQLDSLVHQIYNKNIETKENIEKQNGLIND